MSAPARVVGAAFAALLLLGTTACQPQDRYFAVANELDVPVFPFRWDSSDVTVPDDIGSGQGVAPGDAWQIGLLTQDHPW